jgi:glycosyltransferase involved in cell wall biosynthesis
MKTLKRYSLLHVIRSMNAEKGGVASAVNALVQAQRDMGHRVKIMHMDDRGFDIAMGSTCGDYGYAENLEDWIREHAHEFDAVILHGLWQYANWAFARFLSKNIPFFIYPHGMLDPWFKNNNPIKHIKKWLYWNFCERLAFKKAQAILFSNELEMKAAKKTFLSPSFEQKSRIVGLGAYLPEVNLENARKAFLEAHSLEKKAPYLIYMGRLHPKKGVNLLIHAWKKILQKYPGLEHTLLIAGPVDNKEHARHLQLLAKSAQRSIQFLPMLFGLQKYGALSAADYLILPSHQENFAMVIAEALAAGTLVCTTYKVNTWPAIQDNNIGFVEPDTLEGVYHLLEKAIQESPTEEKRQKAHMVFNQSFDATQAAQKFIALLK